MDHESSTVEALAELVTGSACVGCGFGGRLLCPACARTLPDRAEVRWPTPTPPGLAVPWSAGEYAGLLRAMVLGLKESHLLALAEPLGLLLAHAVAAAHADLAGSGAPVVLVPVPSRRASVRARGHDAIWSTAQAAARHLRAAGCAAFAHRLLVVRGPLRDQAGLSATQRAANLSRALWVPRSGLDRLRRRSGVVIPVVCDDVLTTGATAREAQRALTAVGLAPHGIAVVAAARRRDPRKVHSRLSGGSLAPMGGTD